MRRDGDCRTRKWCYLEREKTCSEEEHGIELVQTLNQRVRTVQTVARKSNKSPAVREDQPLDSS